MDSRQLGLMIIGLGVLAIVIGALVAAGGLSWFGRLPGDIGIESGNTRIYIPLMSMFVPSVALSLVLATIRRFF